MVVKRTGSLYIQQCSLKASVVDLCKLNIDGYQTALNGAVNRGEVDAGQRVATTQHTQVC